VVARTPAELAECLEQLGHAVMGGAGAGLAYTENIFIGSSTGAPRIAFLFPGQGSPTHLDGGLWRRRFEGVRELYERAELPADGDAVSTRVMQPAVVTASLAALKVLGDLGITAGAAVGHSLGEITALHWAGAFDEETLRRLARVRGAAMADLGSPTGVMLAIAAPWHEVLPLLNGEPLAIVGYNSPRQTVVAGEAEAGKKLARRAAGRGGGAGLAGEPAAGVTCLSHAVGGRGGAGAGGTTGARKNQRAAARGVFDGDGGAAGGGRRCARTAVPAGDVAGAI
jgi:enediyne polyketide synthase